MDRDLTITGILGHDDIMVTIPNGATLVTGKNATGKTSLAKCLAATTAHDNNPHGFAAAYLKLYQKGSGSNGSAALSGGATWTPPNMTVPDDCAPESLPHCVGLEDFLFKPQTSEKDKAGVYESLFLPNDPEQLIRKAWGERDQRQLITVIEQVKAEGWDAAASLYNTNKLNAKRTWDEITGERYGKTKAASWKPTGWRAEIEQASRDEIMNKISELDLEMEGLVTDDAVTADRINRGKAVRDTVLPPKRAQLAKAEEDQTRLATAVEAVKAPLEEARAKADELKNSIKFHMAGLVEVKEQTPSIPCPHCEKPLQIVGGKIEKHDAGSYSESIEANNKAINEKVKAVEAELEPVIADGKEKRKAFDEAQQALDNNKNAVIKLKAEIATHEEQAKDADLKETMTNDAELNKIKNALAVERENLMLLDKFRTANDAHNNAVEYEAIQTLLGPTGCRHECMQESVALINSRLARVCEVSGWPEIKIDERYQSLSNGRPAYATSESEKLRVQWAVSIAIGLLKENVKWIVLDAADTIKDEYWDGLVAVVNLVSQRMIEVRKEFHVVVCATSTATPEGWNTISLDK